MNKIGRQGTTRMSRCSENRSEGKHDECSVKTESRNQENRPIPATLPSFHQVKWEAKHGADDTSGQSSQCFLAEIDGEGRMSIG